MVNQKLINTLVGCLKRWKLLIGSKRLKAQKAERGREQ